MLLSYLAKSLKTLYLKQIKMCSITFIASWNFVDRSDLKVCPSVETRLHSSCNTKEQQDKTLYKANKVQ